MIFKYLHLLIVLTFTLSFYDISTSEKETENTGKVNGNMELSYQPDSLKENTSTESFVFQEFNYYAPLSGKVFLAWYPENYSPENAVGWNPGTKFTHNLMYTPIPMHGDTFSIRLKVPKGTILQYNFWITKNKEGHYQDFWDLQSSGKTVVSGENPINKDAIYSKPETVKNTSIIALIQSLLYHCFFSILFFQLTNIVIVISCSEIAFSIFLTVFFISSISFWIKFFIISFVE